MSLCKGDNFVVVCFRKFFDSFMNVVCSVWERIIDDVFGFCFGFNEVYGIIEVIFGKSMV